jgi:Raf kinase inhibitor-like YbhB/YbcL family protein
LPPALTSLPEAVTKFPPQTKLGKNSWGKTNYGGPCPPDKQHRYFFKLFALSSVLDLPNGTTKKQIESTMKDYVIEQAQLIGLYARP